MAAIRIRRNSTTPKGLLRRVSDAEFDEVADPRDSRWVLHPLEGVLRLAVLGLASGARSTRAVENRSATLRPHLRAMVGVDERVSDNAFGALLSQLCPLGVRDSLIRQVKAEWVRKNLRPECLPVSSVAIDGKHLATIPEKRLRGLVSQHTPLDGDALSHDELRRVLSTQFPWVQLQVNDDWVGGLVRVHRATLISGDSAVVMDQWPIKGDSNEIDTIEQTLEALFAAYGRTKMVEMVTLDAGNTSKAVARKLRSKSAHYFMALKTPQGELHELAVEHLAERPGNEAEFCTSHDERGKSIYYSVWRHQIDGDHGWEGAQQIVRVERVVASDEGEASVGNRYFVCSMPANELTAEHTLGLARAHWRCENEGHWTADAIWDEDARRTPWTQHPDGVLVVGLLRSIAINILAVLRSTSRLERGDALVKPTWKTCIEQVLQVVFEPLLDMTEFNAFEV